jgi:putative tryptophan/tyrosine transport system substrate-binding protein
MAINIGRRQLIVTLGGGAVAWPLAGRAQQAKKIPRIGVLLFGTPDTDPNLGAFIRGLRDLGYIEAQNIVFEYRYAEGKPERLRGLAGELVATKPDLIFALGGDVAPSARVATNTIPIVVAVSNDPVQAGLVASLAHPGGNITGVTFVSSDLAAKRLQFLREIAPNLLRVAVIWNPDHVDPEYRETQTAAKVLGIQIQSLEVRGVEDFDAAFQGATSPHPNYVTTNAYKSAAHYRVFNSTPTVACIRLWAVGKGRCPPQLWTRHRRKHAACGSLCR